MGGVAGSVDDVRAPDRPLPWLAWVGVVLAVAAGVAGRVLVDSPLWLDEALSVNIASLPLGDIADALRQDGHPPLYYWLLHGWMVLAGESDMAVRSLSVVLGVAALPLAWLLGRRIGGNAVGAWSVVLLALAPYAVRYSAEARMYALVMLLVLAGALLVLDALGSPTRFRLLAIGAVTAGLLYTQYWSAYLLMAVGGALLWRWRTGTEEGRAAGRVLGALAAGGVAFLPWLPVFLDQARHTGTPWALPARPAQIVSDTLNDLGTGGVDLFSEGQLFGALVAILVVVGVLGTRDRRDGAGVGLSASIGPGVRELAIVTSATLGMGAVVGRLTGSAFNSRYAAIVVPFVLVLAAVGLVKLPRRWPAMGGAVAVIALSLAGIAKVATTDRTEAEILAGRIVEREAPGDVVVSCPDQLGVSLDRALRQAGSGAQVLAYPDLDGDPRYMRWRDYEERNDAADPSALAVEVDARTDDAVWLVWNGSYRTFEGDCEQLVSTLGSLRGAPEVVGEEPDERAFEHADLYRFEAR